MWFIASMIGSISLVVLNSLSKLFTFNYANCIIVGLLSLFTTGCFWYSWQSSPKPFLSVWFLNSAMVTIGAFVANEWWICEPIEYTSLIYILLILVGIVGLRWG